MAIKVLIAPDKFKGSLTAIEVGEAIREGLLQVNPTLKCEVVPLADGGEGTSEVLTNFSKGTFHKVVAHNPLNQPISAQYGLSNDGRTAFMEMAAASGLHLIPLSARNPLYTSTLGTGELIRHALDRGVRSIFVGIGGSATNDAGMGAMIALGVRYYDDTGALLDGRGQSLSKIHHIDITHLHPAMAETSFTIFCDVDNPLYGPQGAAHVFGPQKGATPAIVDVLDTGLRHYDAVLQRHGYTNTSFPGVGAGGGFPLSLAVFGHATIRSGIDTIIDFVKLEQRVSEAQLVITGEGRLDEQTLSGKVVKGVSSLAMRLRKPVVAVTGSTSLSREDLQRLGIRHAITLVNKETTTDEAISRASDLIRQRVRENYLDITG